eukprot:TRINITY_DN5060_c0_g1_i2.p1 TRINITY_DN5060_c0_g1~~TRINITY_DN5060_c0_g1_i2.p1  ORF type:complete len:176 (+),score=17.84 TRINITY_DN5060_c0_g1_i2:643-1170(+)
MMSAISNLPSLSRLQLCLPQPQDHKPSITDKTMSSLSIMLSSLINLSHLDLNLSKNWRITNSGVIEVSRGLAQLTHLTSFQMNLRGTGISDVGLSHLMEAIQSLQHLSLLNLNLSRCAEVVDASKSIESVLRERISLVDVNLNIWDTGITGCAVANLRGIKETRQFQKFEINARS